MKRSGRQGGRTHLFRQAWVVLCCLAAASYAGSLDVSSELVQWVDKKYGEEARERVVAWKSLMEQNGDKSEEGKLKLVNDFFNRLPYHSDWRLWKKEDYWATPIEALGIHGADCEDYSIAKYFTLRELGVDEKKLRIMYVKALELNEPHMVLTYYETPGSVPLVLDNLKKNILSATKRTDLAPVYSFNAEGLWLAKSRGGGKKVGTSKRISLWEELKARLAEEMDK
ncbi:MAG: transglutaminase-like cysteine peptidase [Sedimenticola sp.]